MSSSAIIRVPLNRYLGTSYSPDCDYLDGELLERNVGERDHSKLKRRLIIALSTLPADPPIHVFPEQRVQVRAARYRVPDITVVVGPEPEEQILTKPPYLCIEILSPSDRMQEMQERIDDYLNFGVEHVWLIQPRTLRAFIYTTETASKRSKTDGCPPDTPPSVSHYPISPTKPPPKPRPRALPASPY